MVDVSKSARVRDASLKEQVQQTLRGTTSPAPRIHLELCLMYDPTSLEKGRFRFESSRYVYKRVDRGRC